MQVIFPEARKKAIYPVKIFQEGWELWLKRLAALTTIAAIFYIPLTIFSWVISALSPAKPASSREIALSLGLFSLNAAVSGILGSWAGASMILTIKKSLAGSLEGAGENIKQGLSYLWRYLFASLLYSAILGGIAILSYLLVVVLGALGWRFSPVLGGAIIALVGIPCIFIFVYFALRLSMVTMACVVDDFGPVQALKHSHALVKEYVTPVVGEFCLVALLAFIVFIPGTIIAEVFIFLKLGLVTEIIRFLSLLLASLLITPLSVSIFVLLYNKLKEASGPDVRA